MSSPALDSPPRAASKPLISNDRNKASHSCNPLRSTAAQDSPCCSRAPGRGQPSRSRPAVSERPDHEKRRPMVWCGQASHRRFTCIVTRRLDHSFCRSANCCMPGRHVEAHRNRGSEGEHRQPAVLRYRGDVKMSMTQWKGQVLYGNRQIVVSALLCSVALHSPSCSEAGCTTPSLTGSQEYMRGQPEPAGQLTQTSALGVKGPAPLRARSAPRMMGITACQKRQGIRVEHSQP
jgi:hypothetical protein